MMRRMSQVACDAVDVQRCASGPPHGSSYGSAGGWPSAPCGTGNQAGWLGGSAATTSRRRRNCRPGPPRYIDGDRPDFVMS
jgi:hypothetical protein